MGWGSLVPPQLCWDGVFSRDAVAEASPPCLLLLLLFHIAKVLRSTVALASAVQAVIAGASERHRPLPCRPTDRVPLHPPHRTASFPPARMSPWPQTEDVSLGQLEQRLTAVTLSIGRRNGLCF
ncbi:hypothetical protein AGOR_G00219480 [Albula goreensis]|uniref:Uncharacterized protein n=1 Tax=Albula goreensis TaxID=1534307 RepID=A0A8T3CQ19_9TELE|nr:hypothetical protein AGOR_G00219480 [Albula goreensis]